VRKDSSQEIPGDVANRPSRKESQMSSRASSINTNTDLDADKRESVQLPVRQQQSFVAPRPPSIKSVEAPPPQQIAPKTMQAPRPSQARVPSDSIEKQLALPPVEQDDISRNKSAANFPESAVHTQVAVPVEKKSAENMNTAPESGPRVRRVSKNKSAITTS
jgi:hypothetical protein